MTYPAPVENPKKRSGGLTALGVLNIAFGALSICGSIVTFFGMALMPLVESPLSQMLQTMGNTGLMIVENIVSLALGIGLTVAGVGLLKVVGWGRTLSLWVAGLIVCWTLLDFLFNMVYVFPRIAEVTGMPVEAAQVGVIGRAVMGVVSTICSLIYPIIVFVLLNSESMKRQFLPSYSPGLGQDIG